MLGASEVLSVGGINVSGYLASISQALTRMEIRRIYRQQGHLVRAAKLVQLKYC